MKLKVARRVKRIYERQIRKRDLNTPQKLALVLGLIYIFQRTKINRPEYRAIGLRREVMVMVGVERHYEPSYTIKITVMGRRNSYSPAIVIIEKRSDKRVYVVYQDPTSFPSLKNQISFYINTNETKNGTKGKESN